MVTERVRRWVRRDVSADGLRREGAARCVRSRPRAVGWP